MLRGIDKKALKLKLVFCVYECYANVHIIILFFYYQTEIVNILQFIHPYVYTLDIYVLVSASGRGAWAHENMCN